MTHDSLTRLTHKTSVLIYYMHENGPYADLLTMLWTTEVLINKIINEQQPRVVYFASYCRGKWLHVDDNNWILQYVTFR